MAGNALHQKDYYFRLSPLTLFWLGIMFGVAFYLLDTLVDVYYFSRGDLRTLLLHPGGHELWMRLSVMFVAMLFAGFAFLIVKREHLATERAITAERFLNSVIDNIPDMIFIKEAQDLRFVRVNPATERILGLTGKELLGHDDYDVFPEIQADFFTSKDREVLQTGKVVSIPEEEVESRHLGTRMLRTKKVPIHDDAGQPAFLLGIAEDITDICRAEQALQKTETRFQALFNSAAEFIFVIDAEGKILVTNRYAIENSGYAESEIVGSNIKKFFTEQSQHTCDCNFPRLRETGSSRADIEFVCRDGRVLQMECSATAVPDQAGNFTTFLIIQRDVTERVQAEAALADSERRFKAIFNSTYQLIGLLDAAGTVLEVNRTALDFLGMELADIVGMPFTEVVSSRLTQNAQERVRKAIQDACRGIPVRYEEAVILENGERRIVDFTLKPVTDDNGQTVLIIPEGRDITENRKAEEEARRHLQEAAHVMRLGTMGEMASNIAHELNQPLTALVSYCGTARSLTETLPSQPDKLVRVLERAMEQAHRASDIIRHFREFVCKGNQQRQRTSLDYLVESALGLLSGELHNENVMIELHLGGGDCYVYVDRIQLEQVIINLLRNSIDAIVQSGREDGRVDVYTRIHPDNTAELAVIDNGPGVAPELLGHIFEPFQSGKATGMGMGLSISRSIIESHGGRLWNNRFQQGGAQFGFTLPQCERENGTE
jgi:two-component system sensor kinase FixL